MKTLVIALLALAIAPPALAQGAAFRDFELLPVEKAVGVSRFSECPSYSHTCTLWVRLPSNLPTAHLTYSAHDQDDLWVPLSVSALTQEEVDATYRPGPLHKFLSGGFFGFRLEISRNLAKTASISIGSAESGFVYQLKSVAAWLPDGR